MPKLSKIIVIAILGFSLSLIIVFRLNFLRKQALLYKTESEALAREKSTLEKTAQEKQVRVSALESELEKLSNARALRSALGNAETQLAQMNETLDRVNKEREVLKQENLNLTSRVNSLTREFTKTFDEIRSLKEDLLHAKSGSLISGYEKKLERADLSLQDTQEKLRQLEAQVVQLKEENRKFQGDNKSLETQVVKLEKENERLGTRLEKLADSPRAVSGEGQAAALDGLKKELRDKTSQYELLQKTVERSVNEKKETERKLAQVQDLLEQLRKEFRTELLKTKKSLEEYESFKAQHEILKIKLDQAEKEIETKNQEISGVMVKLNSADDQLSQTRKNRENLSSELAFLKQERINIDETLPPDKPEGALNDRLNKAYALYDTARAQVVKFSELLMKKEIEIERSKEQISSLQDEVRSLKSGNVVAGEKEIERLKERISALDREIMDREDKIKEQNVLMENIKKEKEFTERELAQKRREAEDTNLLYSNLKGQVVHMTDLLVKNEADLEQKNKEITRLQGDVVRLENDFKNTFNELGEVKERHRRTMDDLSRAAKLNSALQENLVGLYKNAGNSEEQQKVNALKQELEKLLTD